MDSKLSRLIFSLLIVGFLLTMTLAGCSRPPKAEKEAALLAGERSRAAGAERYAAADYAAAEKLWNSAESQVKDKKYEEAKQTYINAGTAFEKAYGNVEAGKKAMVPEAAAAVAEVEKGWKKLEIKAKTAVPRMKDKKRWENNSQGFIEGLQTAKKLVSTDPAAAKDKAVELKSFIDKYNKFFQLLSSRPARPHVVRKKTRGADKDL